MAASQLEAPSASSPIPLAEPAFDRDKGDLRMSARGLNSFSYCTISPDWVGAVSGFLSSSDFALTKVSFFFCSESLGNPRPGSGTCVSSKENRR